MTERVKTMLDGLNLSDRFLFDETMENVNAYSAAVGILLEQETELLVRVETEKELRISPELRSVRLDVAGMDRSGKIYYTEMQKRDTRNLKRRSRFYQAQMDVSLLAPGSTDFNRLPDTCFILVAPFDIFGKGLYRYTFEGQCRECPELRLNDGAMRIFINTRGTNSGEFSREFLDFMEYIEETTDEVADRSASGRIRLIHETVKQVRASEKMGVKIMQKWEELAYARQDGVEEGRKEGKKEGRKEGLEEGRMRSLISQVCKKLRKGKTPEQIAEDLEEEEATIRRICEAAAAFAPQYDSAEVYQRISDAGKASQSL